MTRIPGGLSVEVTDGPRPEYRGLAVLRPGQGVGDPPRLAQAAELKPRGITAVALTPGIPALRAMLDHFGVTADNWHDAITKDPHFAASENPPLHRASCRPPCRDPGKRPTPAWATPAGNWPALRLTDPMAPPRLGRLSGSYQQMVPLSISLSHRSAETLLLPLETPAAPFQVHQLFGLLAWSSRSRFHPGVHPAQHRRGVLVSLRSSFTFFYGMRINARFARRRSTNDAPDRGGGEAVATEETRHPGQKSKDARPARWLSLAISPG